jgi:hypothetical protein
MSLDSKDLEAAASNPAEVDRALRISQVKKTPAEMRALDAWVNQRKLAEDSLRVFVEQAWDVLEPGTKFIPGIHVDAVCQHLQALIEDRISQFWARVTLCYVRSRLVPWTTRSAHNHDCIQTDRVL